jgi:hypothetical protein
MSAAAFIGPGLFCWSRRVPGMIGLLGWMGGEMGYGSEGNGKERQQRGEKKSTEVGQRNK